MLRLEALERALEAALEAALGDGPPAALGGPPRAALTEVGPPGPPAEVGVAREEWAPELAPWTLD